MSPSKLIITKFHLTLNFKLKQIDYTNQLQLLLEGRKKAK